jgi:hypothetical protein
MAVYRKKNFLEDGRFNETISSGVFVVVHTIYLTLHQQTSEDLPYDNPELVKQYFFWMKYLMGIYDLVSYLVMDQTLTTRERDALILGSVANLLNHYETNQVVNPLNHKIRQAYNKQLLG